MLSAFSARPIIELRPRDKSKIETILAYGDRVLVGLNSGALRVYRLNDPTSNQGEHPAPGDEDTPASPPNGNGDHRPGSRASDRPTDLLREVEKFSTRAIEQLAIIREANIIVSLSNYQVSLHDRQTYELIETLSKSKNASCFAVTSNVVEDPDSEIPEIISRLAVAVKRRLLLWSWHQSELSDDVAEFVLPESIRSVTWVNANKLICGMNGGFVLVDVATQELQDIISPGSLGTNGQGSRFGSISSASMGYMGLGGYTPKPLAARLANGEVLLAKDINTLFVDDSGKPKERAQVPWTAAPESIGYSYPYILALQAPSKGSLEVRNPDTLSLLQTVSLPGAAQLHFPPPTVSLAHTAKNFHISSERCIWKMGSIDYDTQVQELVQGGHFDEAISILNMLEDALLKDKTETLREVKMQKAEMLFKKKKYRKSLDLFNEDDVHAPPERVLKLYPPHISGELSAWATQDDDQSDGKEASPKKANGTRPSSPDAADHPSSPTNVGGFAKLFMGGGHKRNQSDAASITSSKKEGAETEDNESIKEPRKSEEGPLEGKDLMDAVKELGSYLVGTRTRLQRIIDPVTGKLKRESIDSANGEDDIEKFLRITPTESEKEREQEILKMCKLVDTTLFRAYMFSSPTLAGSLFRLPNFCDPEVVNEKLLEHSRYTQLVDFFYGKKLHKEALDLLQRFGAATKPDPAAPTLHGPDRTIQYLQNLPPSESELILKYSGWTLKANPDYAMEIFIGDTENAETLPRDRVLAFLRELDPKLELQYLVHIIDELDDATPDFHNRLVELYVKNLKEMKRDDQWHEQMARFVKFLQESRQVYSLSKAFGLIPKEDPAFYEAQAIVLSNMGQHKQALVIYVFKMKDYVKAEEYCNRVHRSHEKSSSSPDDEKSPDSDDDEPSIYHTLLSLYLQPKPPHEPNLDPALDLLSKHGSRLPATSTLGLIPDDLPVGDLESYFRGRIRAANSLVNQTRIVSELRKAEGISVAARLHLGDDVDGGQGGRNRHVTITDERLCVVCHKKLAGMRIGGTVVAVLPDNTVVHYGCLNKATGHRGENVRALNWGRGF